MGYAKVEPNDLPKPLDVLKRNRLIQPERTPQLRFRFRRDDEFVGL